MLNKDKVNVYLPHVCLHVGTFIYILYYLLFSVSQSPLY